MRRRHWLLSSAAAAIAWPAARAQGDHALVTDLLLHDPLRGRVVPVRLRLPADAAPAPLLLYSHGLGGSREGGDVWGRAWCAGGFGVMHLQHLGSDRALWSQGPTALRAAASAEQLLARAADVRFVLDELLRQQHRGVWWASRLRRDGVGMAGHLFGARTVQALAGEHFAAAPGVMLAEPRIRAFVALSPSMGRDGPQAFAAITRPFLGASGSRDGDPLGAFADGASRASVVDALPPGAKALLWLADADHGTFAGHGDPPLRGAWLPPLLRRAPEALALEARHHALVADISTAWWRRWLADDEDAAQALRAPPGLVAGDRWVAG